MPKDEIVNLAARRSLFYPTAEIYPGAPSGFFDFGPDGETIRRKVLGFWRNELVEREKFVEIFGRQILPEAVFKASGHLESFNDPIVQCGKCHSLFRADKLIEEQTGKHVPESAEVKKIDSIIGTEKVVCKKCKGKLGNVRKFNMMMKVDIGATGDLPCYLRPETCQTIFLDFARVYKTMRRNLPLGIAQAGASFRNEISPRQSLLRGREFGQMEVEIFFNPKKIADIENFDDVKDYRINLMLLNKGEVKPIRCEDAVKDKIVSGKLVAYYLARVQQLYSKYGVPVEKMRFRELDGEERAFYAKETWDFEVEIDLGWMELMACNYRTDYDLSGHAKVSGQDLSVVEDDGGRFVPHIFELSAGIDRTFYVLLDLAYRKEKRGPDERVYLSLSPRIAPYLVAVFPLVKKDGLRERANEILSSLQDYELDAFYDEKGSIGKRYARVDEIGVPYVATIDYDTKKDNTVTLRDRDSMGQKRVNAEELPGLLWKLKMGKILFQNI